MTALVTKKRAYFCAPFDTGISTEQLLQQVTSSGALLDVRTGRATPRQYETTCGHVFPVDPFTSLCQEKRTLVVKSVSQGDSNWFNIIEMVDLIR